MNTQVQRRKPLTANIGIIGVGHHIYWPQFEGLLDELQKKLTIFESKIKKYNVSTVNFGIIDCAEGAYKALLEIRGSNLDILFVDMLTYATSSTFGAIVRDLNIPIVLVALQPLSALDYSKASTYMQLCNDDFCSVPEFTGVAMRMGKKIPDVIIGILENDAQADTEIEEWIKIARVMHDLKNARIGHMGHVLEAMLDMHSDPAAITGVFGCHVAQCEPDDILKYYAKNSGSCEVAEKKKEILSFFDTPDPVSDPITCRLTDEDLDTAARVYDALEKFISEKKLDGLAYYYEGLPDSEIRKVVTNLIVGNSLLTAAGFPMCGEFDIKTCLAMMIMDRLEIGGSFAEFHPIDFARGTVLVGHDGPHHINIADGRPVLRSLKKYHGKPGSGAGVEFRIKEGPITMLSIGVRADGKFKMIIAEGESMRHPIPATGNTNTHGLFKPDVRTFLKNWAKEGPTHHFALGIGAHSGTIVKIAEALNIESVVV